MGATIIYEIVIQEQLDEQWAEWFLPLGIHKLPNGYTTLKGIVRDQGELHGILSKVRDLNLTLIAVSRITSMPKSGSN